MKLKQLFCGILAAALAASILAGCREETNGTSSAASQAVSAASASSVQTISKTSAQLKQQEQPQFLSKGIRMLSVSKSGQETFRVEYAPASYKSGFDSWTIPTPYQNTVMVDTQTMYELFDKLAAVSFTSPAQVKTGTDTGIANSTDSFTLQFLQTKEESTAVSAPDADSTATVLLGKEDGSGNVYAAVKGKESVVYLISKDTADALRKIDPYAYILKIAGVVNAASVSKVTMETGAKTYMLEIDGGTYRSNGKTLGKDSFTSLYKELLGLELTGKAEKAPASGTAADLTVTFSRTTAKAPQMQFIYTPQSGDTDTLTVNGNTFFTVSHTEVQAICKKIAEVCG